MRQSGIPADEPRAAAIDALRDVLVWQLPPDDWTAVERVVESIGAAVAAADPDALAKAAADMDPVSPYRIISIGLTPGEPAPVPAPEELRERANHLIHSLGGTGSSPDT